MIHFVMVCFSQGVKGREGSRGFHGSPGEKVSGFVVTSCDASIHMMTKTKCNKKLKTLLATLNSNQQQK